METIIEKLDNVPIKQSIESVDEFDYIRKRLIQVIEHISKQHQLSRRLAVESKELETQLLQDLINPHFLYNALEGIRYACNDMQANLVIDHLIQFYRHALNRGLLYLTIEKELNMVENYVQIQRFAYESAFQLDISLPPALKDVQMMKFLLQPFVENAILHGIDKQGDRGCIRIDVSAEENMIVFTIQDNGCGIEQERLALLTTERLSDGDTRKGYGIYNVQRRIHNLYGNEYGVTIQSKIGQGTTVRVTIPRNPAAQTAVNEYNTSTL